MRDKASAEYVTVYMDAHGVKYIAPFHIIRRKRRRNFITKGEKSCKNGKYSKSQTKKNISS